MLVLNLSCLASVCFRLSLLCFLNWYLSTVLLVVKRFQRLCGDVIGCIDDNV